MEEKEMRKIKKRVISLMLSSVMLFSPITGKMPADALEHNISNTFDHGTTDTIITKDMLKNTPPEDYKVDMTMQAEAKDKLYDKFFLDDALQTVKIEVDENNLNYIHDLVMFCLTLHHVCRNNIAAASLFHIHL